MVPPIVVTRWCWLPTVAAACAAPAETWLVHMRRSGSTTIRNWLANLSGPKRWNSLQVSPSRSYYNDTASVTPACWDLGARYAANGRPTPDRRLAPTITHMRAPLERMASEFAYRGPPVQGEGGTEAAWRAWLSQEAYWRLVPKDPRGRSSVAPWRFGPKHGPLARWAPVDNYYIRSLAPPADQRCARDCAPPVGLGGRAGTLGCEMGFPPPRLDESDLRRAMGVLERHVDAVVPLELYGDADLQAWILRDVMGGCVREGAPAHPPRMNAARTAAPQLPPESLVAELSARNALDAALYEWARNRTVTQVRAASARRARP